MKNRDKKNKISNDLYHSKYKKDETFLKKVSIQKAKYYRNNEDIKLDNIFNDISTKFNINNEVLHNIKNEFDIKIKK